MRHCFIINPAAGKGKSVDMLSEKISRACEGRGVDFEIYLTKAPNDAQDYIMRTASSSSDGISFYACGGDGTLCETLAGIMALPSRENIYLGLIPAGTGNDFARNFVPKDCYFDIDAQLDASAHKIDIIKAGDAHAINMVNIGFDCEVVCKTASLKKSPLIPSKLAYIAGLVVTLIKKPGVKADISFDGEEPHSEELLLTTFANGCFCGGGFHSNPLACTSDGLIDRLLVSNISRTRFISLVGDYKKGTHLGERFAKIIRHGKAKEVLLSFKKETNVCVDGEVIRTRELRLSVLKGAVNFLVPKGASPASHAKECVGAQA